MVTVKPSNYLNEYYGLSTDTKPTFEKMPNGSIFYEMDTGNIYMWDEENHEWFQQYDGSEDDREPVSINIDKTLSNEGSAADAKAAGDGINAVKAALAPEFDEDEYYPANTHVWHDGTLYTIFVEHDSGVSWEDTITGPVVIGGAITSLLNTLDSVAFSNAIAYRFEENVNYDKDALVWQNGGVYRLPYGHTAGVAWGNFFAVPTNLAYELETRLYFLKERIAPIFSEGVAHPAQSCVWYRDRLYKLLSDHEAGTGWGTFQKIEVTVADLIPDEVQIDTTLKRAGAAADARATGGAIADVKSTISFFDDIPGTVQTVNFDANGNPSSIVHTANGEAVRTDSFTWGDNTVTEKRELADGSYITFVTDLTTLVTTISEIQEA